MRILLTFFLVLHCLLCGAQYNKDCKQVSGKKIRHATAYTVSQYNDTTFRRYSYDTKGRLIESRSWQRNGFTSVETFSASGKLIKRSTVSFTDREDTVVYVNGNYSTYYDTAGRHIEMHDEITGKLTYELDLMYAKGKPYEGWLIKNFSDTLFYYFFRGNNFHLEYLMITLKVDSLKWGYSETQYSIKPKNKDDFTGPQDTSIISNVTVVDKHGYPIRYYELIYGEDEATPVKGRNGVLYSPVHDTLAYLRLHYTSQNFYRKDGSLEYSITTNFRTKQSTRRDQPLPHPPMKRIDSLQEIQKLGPTTFEYYK